MRQFVELPLNVFQFLEFLQYLASWQALGQIEILKRSIFFNQIKLAGKNHFFLSSDVFLSFNDTEVKTNANL